MILQRSRLLFFATALLLTSCTVFSPSKKTASPAMVGSPPVAAAAALSPGTEERVLRELPVRVRDFLISLKVKVLAKDWEWVRAKAEPSHVERYGKKRGMDTISYLSLLFRVGDTYAAGKSPLLPEPRSFDLSRVKSMTYTKARKQGFSWLVQGVFTDENGVSIDFTLDVLGELREILLSGD